MKYFELTNKETEEIRYTLAESAADATAVIQSCSRPREVTCPSSSSPYNPWDYADNISVRELSEEEAAKISPSKIEKS